MVKKIMLLLFMLSPGASIFAQRTDSSAWNSSENPLPPSPKEKADLPDKVFTVVEHMPEYPGGQPAMTQYLSQNIRYPEYARKNNIQGKVVVKFVIDRDGSVFMAEIIRPIGGGCDEEALRVVKAMPRWKPGLQLGKPIRVYYTMPINFRLSQ